MMWVRMIAVWVLLMGCGTSAHGPLGPKPVPSLGAKPAVKKELPWLALPGGRRMKTTLFYGPWQCRKNFMRMCQAECAREGYPLMGCIWLADLEFEWEGQLVALPVPVEAGSHYGIWNCCCDFPVLPKNKRKAGRDQWKSSMESFRQTWGRRFGEWPTAGSGVNWPGHHIRDLWHGGNPVDPNNVFPVEPGVHSVYNKVYPSCYRGEAPWNTIGPDLPYTDH